MKKIVKFAYSAIIGLTVLATAACTNEYSYDGIAPESGQEVYFPTSNESSIDLKMGDGMLTFEIPVTRVKTDAAATVNISSTVAQHSALFSIPSSVAFAAGEAQTTLKVSYNAAELGYENPDTLSFTIADDASVTPYGAKDYTVAVVIPAPLEKLGTGTFTDNFWFEEGNDVVIYQNTLDRNQFRIMDPFAMCAKYGACTGNQSPEVTITILQPGQTLAGVEITKKDLVYFTSMNTGYYHSSYGQEVWLHHPAAFSSLRNESAWLYSKVVDWQENGLPGRIQLAPYYYMDGVGGWNNTQANGVVVIDFPGYTPKDLSLDLTYAGIFTNVASEVFAVGNLTLGEDVTTAKAVVVEQDADAEAVADAILAGELEATDVVGGRIEVPIPEGLTGKLQLIVVVIDGDAVKNIATAKFEYYGGGANPWQSLGIGYVTDDVICPTFGYDPEDFAVNISESTETPGLSRLDTGFGPLSALFEEEGNEPIEIHAEDPKGVYILEQYFGSDFGYGAMGIVTDAGDLVAEYGFDAVKAQLPNIFGAVSNGVITFPVLEGTTSSGKTVNYQCYLIMGDGYYFGGRNGLFQIVLPNANASVKAKAQARVKAAEFAHRLHPNKLAGQKRGKTVGKVMCRRNPMEMQPVVLIK